MGLESAQGLGGTRMSHEPYGRSGRASHSAEIADVRMGVSEYRMVVSVRPTASPISRTACYVD